LYLDDTVRREKRQVLMAAIGIALAVMVLAPPIVEAATQKVSVQNKPTVKKVEDPVKVANGSAIEVQNLGAFGALSNQNNQFPTKAIGVATVAGGGGFHGAGECSAVAADNTVTVEATGPGNNPNIVTGIIISSPSATPVTVTVTAPDVQAGPIIALRNSAERPTEFIGFGNGLTVSPSELVFQCPAGAPVAGASFVVLGQ
jgi:hypothetical protein